jgi:tetratricopeptide (TPR) repeat protein
MPWLLAISLLSLVSGLTPEQVDAKKWLKDGDTLLAQERPAEAANAYSEAIRLDPLLMMAHYGLGQARMDLKQYPGAIEAYLGAQKAFDERLRQGFAGRLESDKARDKRVSSLRDRIRDHTGGSRSQNAQLNQMEMELAMLQQSASDVGKPAGVPAGVTLALGSAYFRNNQMKEAEAAYRAALETKPTLGEANNNLAVVLLLTKRPAEAKAQIALAKKNGYSVPEGLTRDIESAITQGAAGTTQP